VKDIYFGTMKMTETRTSLLVYFQMAPTILTHSFTTAAGSYLPSFTINLPVFLCVPNPIMLYFWQASMFLNTNLWSTTSVQNICQTLQC